jgi:pyruvate/2-oxoglutarate dehydrogenase complex dihydrolipoamide acyltransferase (E2) component
VISLDVQPGDRVEVGQALGFLEAMKMEIGFMAPVAGMVTEVRVRKGQQVGAGEVMLVIDAACSSSGGAEAGRLTLPTEADPLAPLFTRTVEGWLGEPDLLAVEGLTTSARRQALEALHEEAWRVILGFDVLEERLAKLLQFIPRPYPLRPRQTCWPSSARCVRT